MATKDEIAKLKQKKEDLDKLLGQEQWYSWNDAAKVDMERKLAEKQLHEMMNQAEPTFKKTFKLKSARGEKKQFTVTDGVPDPDHDVISTSSPIGQKLAQMKAGDKLEIGGEVFELTNS